METGDGRGEVRVTRAESREDPQPSEKRGNKRAKTVNRAYSTFTTIQSRVGGGGGKEKIHDS